MLVYVGPYLFQIFMGLGQILAVRTLFLKQVRYSIGPEAIYPHIEPVTQHLEHFAPYRRVLKIEVGLVAEETVPVILLGDRVPGPVRMFSIGKNNPGILVALIGVAPDIIVAFARVSRAP